MKIVFLLILITIFTLITMIICMYIFSKDYRNTSGIKFIDIINNKWVFGEYLIYKDLTKTEGYFKIITNLYIPSYDDKTTEVDMVLINKYGVFVIESKDYSGSIYGIGNNKYWTQILGDKVRNRFYSPIYQNKSHIIHMLKIIEDISINDVFSIIVFSERCKLKVTNIKSAYIKVIKRNQLIDTIDAISNSCMDVLSEEDIENIYIKLSKYTKCNSKYKEYNINRIE
ncbi:NERD domain-containing protein [Romboutsia weinsteinii]|uniref:NERD domain-containing protein n=1 Tax=Romboutsia weinsteinii TaxID=2020949 RepID=A0A371J8E8_9FIRM|nr:nuclease-related domain-containing protein [Romboutsia weinsteinii]RDY29014.1 NERD domain-containing protein [Romboutsia weinsteinii]